MNDSILSKKLIRIYITHIIGLPVKSPVPGIFTTSHSPHDFLGFRKLLILIDMCHK